MRTTDNKHEEQCVTDASFDDLEYSLKHFGYKITRTKLQITGTRSDALGNASSTITIIDDGNHRIAKNIIRAKGFDTLYDGFLARIVNYAENNTAEYDEKGRVKEDRIQVIEIKIKWGILIVIAIWVLYLIFFPCSIYDKFPFNLML